MNYESMCVSVIEALKANVNNGRISDTDFRNFVRNSLPDRQEFREVIPNRTSNLLMEGKDGSR